MVASSRVYARMSYDRCGDEWILRQICARCHCGSSSVAAVEVSRKVWAKTGPLGHIFQPGTVVLGGNHGTWVFSRRRWRPKSCGLVNPFERCFLEKEVIRVCKAYEREVANWLTVERASSNGLVGASRTDLLLWSPDLANVAVTD